MKNKINKIFFSIYIILPFVIFAVTYATVIPGSETSAVFIESLMKFVLLMPALLFFHLTAYLVFKKNKNKLNK